jgi:complement component 1 Q subcomponent-binding protein
LNDEILSIHFNVNHTVDSEVADEASLRGDKQEQEGEMRSKPNFDIEIKKDKQTLFFSCSFLREQPTDTQEEYSDLFLIEEIALFEGEAQEHTYAVAGDILDGYLYDLFMNMLEDRGIGNEFIEKLSDFATDYEHQLYVGMLKNLQNFVQKK